MMLAPLSVRSVWGKKMNNVEKIERLHKLDQEKKVIVTRLAAIDEEMEKLISDGFTFVGVQFLPKGVKRKKGSPLGEADGAATRQLGEGETARDVILRHFKENPKLDLTVPILSKSLGLPVSQTTSEVYWLMNAKKIARIARGLYRFNQQAA